MTTGSARPHELRQLAEAYPEDIFPTPPEECRAFDAVAADVLRRAAIPHYLACADRIEELEEAIREHERELERLSNTEMDYLDRELLKGEADARLWRVPGDKGE